MVNHNQNHNHLSNAYKSPAMTKEGAGLVQILVEEKGKDEKANIIKMAATAGKITLLTRIFGRGTDFICYDQNLIKAGGMHVIQTFVSEEIAEEVQIMGRTARQGQSGSYSLLLLDTELEASCGIQLPEIEDMKNTGKLHSRIDAKVCHAQCHIY